MREISEQVILVTGATDGLGRGVAADLASRGATVLLHGRSPERLERTLAELRDETGSEKLRTYRADFASLAEVRAMAAEVAANEERLDALVNNAGIGFLPEREFSQDGVELVLQVDYLAGYLLTRELLPLLRASAPSRIVFVASAGQAPIDFDDPMMDQGYDAGRAYCQAKLAQINQTMDMAGGSTATSRSPRCTRRPSCRRRSSDRAWTRAARCRRASTRRSASWPTPSSRA